MTGQLTTADQAVITAAEALADIEMGRTATSEAAAAWIDSYNAAADAVVAAVQARRRELAAPQHGVNALGHGYTSDCDKHGETCNNGACRAGLAHHWCTEECSALVERDRDGCPWQPGHVPEQLR